VEWRDRSRRELLRGLAQRKAGPWSGRQSSGIRSVEAARKRVHGGDRKRQKRNPHSSYPGKSATDSIVYTDLSSPYPGRQPVSSSARQTLRVVRGPEKPRHWDRELLEPGQASSASLQWHPAGRFLDECDCASMVKATISFSSSLKHSYKSSKHWVLATTARELMHGHRTSRGLLGSLFCVFRLPFRLHLCQQRRIRLLRSSRHGLQHWNVGLHLSKQLRLRL